MAEEDCTSTGQLLFEQYKRQQSQISVLVNLLADLIEVWELGNDLTSKVEESKKYLLIDTNLGISYMNG